MEEGFSSTTDAVAFLKSFFFCGIAALIGSTAVELPLKPAAKSELSLAFLVAVLLRPAILAIFAATPFIAMGSLDTTQLMIPAESRDTT